MWQYFETRHLRRRPFSDLVPDSTAVNLRAAMQSEKATEDLDAANGDERKQNKPAETFECSAQECVTIRIGTAICTAFCIGGLNHQTSVILHRSCRGIFGLTLTLLIFSDQLCSEQCTPWKSGGRGQRSTSIPSSLISCLEKMKLYTGTKT